MDHLIYSVCFKTCHVFQHGRYIFWMLHRLWLWIYILLSLTWRGRRYLRKMWIELPFFRWFYLSSSSWNAQLFLNCIISLIPPPINHSICIFKFDESILHCCPLFTSHLSLLNPGCASITQTPLIPKQVCSHLFPTNDWNPRWKASVKVM